MDKKIEEKPIQKPKPRETYNAVLKKKEEYEKKFELYQRLIALGTPKHMVHYYTTPSMPSGYIHGEYIEVRCNGALVEKVDNTNKPDGTRNAYVGTIHYNFNLKSLREYIILCDLKHKEKNWHDKIELMKKKRYLERDFVDWSKSVIDMKALKERDWFSPDEDVLEDSDLEL